MVLLLSNNLKLSFSSPLAADATSVMASSEILVWQNAPLGFNDLSHTTSHPSKSSAACALLGAQQSPMSQA